jgi:anaerobic magnesium-protoporphyrin IX monomethyl ester cyclase
MSKIDCLLVNPNSHKKTYQGLADKWAAIECPFWSCLLAESLRSREFSVEILDTLAENLTPEEAVSRIKYADPRLVAFVTYSSNPNGGTTNMSGTLEIAQLLRKTYPQYKTISIGSHTSALPMEVLSYPCFDYVAINEGVKALHSLLNSDLNTRYVNTLLATKIPGIGYKISGHPFLTDGEASLVNQEEMDDWLPGYAWDLLPHKQKPLDLYRAHNWHALYDENLRTPFASIYSSLGCKFTCNFCMINILNRTNKESGTSAAHSNIMRYWSPEKVLSWFEELVEDYDCTTIRFLDEMFFLNKKYYEPILQGLIDRGYGKLIRTWTYSRIDSVNERFLDLFRDAGVKYLALGIEAARQNIRLEITKGKFKDISVRDVCNKIKNHGINCGNNFIFGHGSETLADMQASYDLAVDLNGEFTNFYCFTPTTKIQIEHGFKDIKDIKCGDVVMSEAGPTRVTNILKRPYNGAVLKIKPRLLPPFTCTPEHPIQVVDICRNYKNKAEVRSKPYFIDAKDILLFNKYSKSDPYNALVVKKFNFVREKTYYDLSNYVKGHVTERVGMGRGGQLPSFGKRYLEPIEVTEDFAELCGWYVAEGSISSRKNNKICFSLGDHEDKNIQRVLYLIGSALGLKGRLEPNGESVIRVVFNSKVWLRAVHDIFGVDCYNKKIPNFIMNGSDDIARAFLKGYARGDGTNTPNQNNQYSLSSASNDLIYQVMLLFLKIGIIPGHAKQLCKPRFIGASKKETPATYAYKLSWLYEQKHKWYYEDQENFYIPLRSVKELEYEGDVYNLETESHTYCLPCVVHNCNMALPGSALYYEAKQNGWKLPDTYEGYSFHSYECQPLPTKHLSPEEVLRFRDEAWYKYFTRPEYLAMIEKKFSLEARRNIEEQTKIKLKRRILGDVS